jgi:hypothetical protein
MPKVDNDRDRNEWMVGRPPPKTTQAVRRLHRMVLSLGPRRVVRRGDWDSEVLSILSAPCACQQSCGRFCGIDNTV